MLVLHDAAGFITGLQLFPPESDAPHIVVSDALFELLKPCVGTIQLDGNGTQFFMPADIAMHVDQLMFNQRKAAKLIEIGLAQSTALTAGVPFNFGQSMDTVQTRNERDLINISGMTTRAILLRANAVTDPVIEFRAQSNTSYKITPEQAIALGETVAQHNEAIYQKAWALKDAITSATTTAELEAVQW